MSTFNILPFNIKVEIKAKDIVGSIAANTAISDAYEPGSVFKVITAAIGIEEGLANVNTSCNCPGYIVIAGQRYSCHKKIGHGMQNFVPYPKPPIMPLKDFVLPIVQILASQILLLHSWSRNDFLPPVQF